jgi:hypothetical protein
MRRALVAAVAVALVAVPAASANGDPASDVLLTEQVFYPFEAPISDSAKKELSETVAEANKRGYPVRVALIAFTGDLGTAVSLWKKPQPYAKFLGSEIAFVYPKRLLVVMPSGFGVYNGKQSVAKEQRALRNLTPGKTPTPLTESAAEAVRAMAASEGITLPKVSSGGGSETRDRLILGGALLVAVGVALVLSTRVFKKRVRSAEQ